MSEPISALNGRLADGPVSIREDGLRGMITLRGDLSAAALRKVCTDLTGMDFPAQGEVRSDGHKGLAWMSPDEVLVLVAHDAVPAALDSIAGALKGQHHLAVDVSDARAVIVVQGPFTREVIAKLAPVDMSAAAMPAGRIRRSRLGQVAAAFWMRDDDSAAVICFRSVAGYAFDLLAASAKAGPVGHH